MGNKSKHGAGRWTPNMVAARLPKTSRSWMGLVAPSPSKFAIESTVVIETAERPTLVINQQQQPWQKAAAKAKERAEKAPRLGWNDRRLAREARKVA